MQTINAQKLTQWEVIRVKTMQERYLVSRAFLQIPVIASSYGLAHVVMGPVMRRMNSGFREYFLFGSVIYLVIYHWLDQRQVPDMFLDELLTQQAPNGEYLRNSMQDLLPPLWLDLKSQMESKGIRFDS